MEGGGAESEAKAEALKNAGNQAFGERRFDEAARLFGEALLLQPDNEKLYSNRSAAYASVGKGKLALADAAMTVKLAPEWSKGYSRLGAAYFLLEQWEEAEKAYERSLQLEPGNKQAVKGMADAHSKVLLQQQEQNNKALEEMSLKQKETNPFDDDAANDAWTGPDSQAAAPAVATKAASATAQGAAPDFDAVGRSRGGSGPKLATRLSEAPPLHSRSERRESGVALPASFRDGDVEGMRRDMEKVLRQRRELEDEVRLLKSGPPPGEAAERLVYGESVALDRYRRLQEKVDLLDRALQLADGDVVLRVILFMRRTLKWELFVNTLQKKPAALRQYVKYLRARGSIEEAVRVFRAAADVRAEAFMMYKRCFHSPFPAERMIALKDTLAFMEKNSILRWEAAQVRDQIDLLGMQVALDEHDEKVQSAGSDPIFSQCPRVTSVAGQSVISTLYYNAFYHYNVPEDRLSYPANMRKKYDIPEKQYVYWTLTARARLQDWEGIETMLTTKGNLVKKARIKAAVGFDVVVRLCHENEAPREVVDKYMDLVPSHEERFNLAVELHEYDTACRALLEMRDRKKVHDFIDYLNRVMSPTDSKKWSTMLNDALRSPGFRWLK